MLAPLSHANHSPGLSPQLHERGRSRHVVDGYPFPIVLSPSPSPSIDTAAPIAPAMQTGGSTSSTQQRESRARQLARLGAAQRRSTSATSVSSVASTSSAMSLASDAPSISPVRANPPSPAPAQTSFPRTLSGGIGASASTSTSPRTAPAPTHMDDSHARRTAVATKSAASTSSSGGAKLTAKALTSPEFTDSLRSLAAASATSSSSSPSSSRSTRRHRRGYLMGDEEQSYFAARPGSAVAAAANASNGVVGAASGSVTPGSTTDEEGRSDSGRRLYAGNTPGEAPPMPFLSLKHKRNSSTQGNSLKRGPAAERALSQAPAMLSSVPQDDAVGSRDFATEQQSSGDAPIGIEHQPRKKANPLAGGLGRMTAM